MTKIKDNEIDLYLSIIKEFKEDIVNYVDNKLLNVETDIDVLKNLLEIDSLTRLSFYKEPNNSLRYKLSPIRVSLLDKYDKREEDTIMNSLRDSKNLFESKDRNSIEYWNEMSNRIDKYILDISQVSNLYKEHSEVEELYSEFNRFIIYTLNKLQDWYGINLFLKKKGAGDIDEYRDGMKVKSYECTERYTLKDEDNIDSGVGVMFGFNNIGSIIKCSLGTKYLNTNYSYYAKNITECFDKEHDIEAGTDILYNSLLWYLLKHTTLQYEGSRRVAVEILDNIFDNKEPKYSNNHIALVTVPVKNSFGDIVNKEFEITYFYRK